MNAVRSHKQLLFIAVAEQVHSKCGGRTLAKEGITAECIETKAEIVLAPDGDSWNIPRIQLIVKAHVPEVG